MNAIPNEETALKIAEALLISAYDDDVLSEKNVSVKLNRIKNAWVVSGRLSEEYDGDVFEIVIKRCNGQILKIYHGI